MGVANIIIIIVGASEDTLLIYAASQDAATWFTTHFPFPDTPQTGTITILQ